MSCDNTVTTAEGIAVYSDNIFAACDSYIAIHDGIDLSKDITQYQFKDVLYYIHDLVFPHKNLLKDKLNGAYDYKLLEGIYDAYKRLCVKYNKITFLADFSILTGIDEDLIVTWSNDYRRLNDEGSKLHKKIMHDNESAVSTQMISSGRNPVGYMAILNHYHHWSTTAAAQGLTDTRKSPDEIAASHGLAVEDRAVETLPVADFTTARATETHDIAVDGGNNH